MSIYGCPDISVNKWKYGYMNISTAYPTELLGTSMEPVLGRGSEGHFLELAGPYGPNNIQLNFCTRVDNDNNISTGDWPTGRYGVFATERACPEGKTFI